MIISRGLVTHGGRGGRGAAVHFRREGSSLDGL
jgi:hypothetical protein